MTNIIVAALFHSLPTAAVPTTTWLDAYLCIAYLQRSGVQLFDPGVVRGHQDTVLPPQNGGGRVS